VLDFPTAEARILAALSDAYPEEGEEDQSDAAASDEAQAAGVISDEREIPTRLGAVIDQAAYKQEGAP
jgi:hypothetical protein